MSIPQVVWETKICSWLMIPCLLQPLDVVRTTLARSNPRDLGFRRHGKAYQIDAVTLGIDVSDRHCWAPIETDLHLGLTSGGGPCDGQADLRSRSYGDRRPLDTPGRAYKPRHRRFHLVRLLNLREQPVQDLLGVGVLFVGVGSNQQVAGLRGKGLMAHMQGEAQQRARYTCPGFGK